METQRRRRGFGLDCSRQNKVTPLPFGDVTEAVDKNRPPNFSSPTRRGTGGTPRKRKPASPCGLSEQRLPPSWSSPPSVPPPLLACLTAPPKRCKGGYDGNFETDIEFTARAYWHTAQKLSEMARDPNAGIKRFTESALARSRDICLPIYGVLISGADNPSDGFVFQSVSCSRDCSFGPSLRCSNCAKPNLMRNFKLSLQPDIDQRPGKTATIQKIANNPILAATEYMISTQILIMMSGV
jgi:hypothetical protein